MTPSNPHITLWSARVCPFAQRTRLVLAAKGLDYTLREVDLDQPERAFLDRSPYAKVPLLECDGDRVWESAIVNEYLEERFPDPPLLPAIPGARAAARLAIDYCNQFLVPRFYKLLLIQDNEAQQAVAARLTESLRHIDEGLTPANPGWFGGAPGLVDFAYYPFFERFPSLTHYRGFAIPAELERLQRWLDAMAVRPEVQRCASPAAFYIERYARYADGSAESDTAREMLAADA